MTKALPKIIYVKTEKINDAEYLVADAEAFALVEMGQKVRIGVYQLVETQTAEGIAKLTKTR